MAADESKQPTSKRQTWEFVYQASTVAQAAERRAKHHGARLAWWEAERKKSEEDLKKKGFEYRQRRYTGGEEIEIVGDPELAKRAADCKQKIRGHAEHRDSYAAWVRALKTVAKRGKSRELTLTIEDVLFFGL